MLEYERTDISEGIDVDKTNLSKNVIFFTVGILMMSVFHYENYFCNGCHDLMQKAMSFNNVAIVYVKGNAYIIHFCYMSKDDAINIINGSNLTDKSGVL